MIQQRLWEEYNLFLSQPHLEEVPQLIIEIIRMNRFICLSVTEQILTNLVEAINKRNWSPSYIRMLIPFVSVMLKGTPIGKNQMMLIKILLQYTELIDVALTEKDLSK